MPVPIGTGGVPGVDGATSTGGTMGTVVLGVGGATNTGDVLGVDGASSTGGTIGTGVPGVGGATNPGSMLGVGGASSTGGTMGTGGSMAQICTPGATVCDGNKATTCNAAGSGYDGTTVDCSLTGKGCDAGVCSGWARDATPTTNMTKASGSGMILNFYSVAVARTLQAFYTNVTSANSSVVGCQVFESATQDGTYQRTRSFLSSGSSGGYVACTQMTALKAGYYYALGVFWTGNETYYYHSTTADFPIPMTFGTLISGARDSSPSMSTTFPWSPSTTLYFPQRLYTSL